MEKRKQNIIPTLHIILLALCFPIILQKTICIVKKIFHVKKIKTKLKSQLHVGSV